MTALQVSGQGSPSVPALLDALAVGVLELDPRGCVMLANAAAVALFSPLDPVGLGLRALLSLSGASNGAELAAAAQARVAGGPIRVDLADGRTLDCRSRPAAAGHTVLTLIDVTAYVRDAAQAQRDPLTGLVNRVDLAAALQALLARARRDASQVAVLCLDLDRFKTVNDSLGHAMGDALLRQVAERLRNAVRQGDLAARLGGDEFAVLQTGAPQPQAAEALARRLVDLISRSYVVDEHMLNVGASIGIAIAPEDGDAPEALLQRADLALYRAKTDGRGVFRFFRKGMDSAMHARRLLEVDLRRALALRQFELAYQPQLRLGPDRVVGFEALLRWHHPQRGAVSPGEFIPLAEEIGLIVPLGEWVLRTACQEAAGWPQPVAIAVNISPVQFRDPRLVAMVATVLADTGLAPARLELEITEGALLENTATVLAALHALRDMGVRISMDDFGTGYSSLAYLRKFPFDKIKIDQSFVRGAHASEGDAIVRAVTALGASLGIATTAEGIETPEQLARMRAEGCTEVQGYLTGRPLQAAAAMALLREAAAAPLVSGDSP